MSGITRMGALKLSNIVKVLILDSQQKMYRLGKTNRALKNFRYSEKLDNCNSYATEVTYSIEVLGAFYMSPFSAITQ